MIDDKTHLLLVDDDEDDFILIQECLQDVHRMGFEIDWANNGDKALGAIRNKPYDVCFLDYRLGRQTGLDLLSHIVNEYPYLPVIMLTGLDDFDIDIQAMKLGATDYLIKKEIDPKILGKSIRYSMERMRSQQEIQRMKDLALQNSKERFAALFNQSPDAILILDPEGAILNSNPAAETLLESTWDELFKKIIFELPQWTQGTVELFKKGVDEAQKGIFYSFELTAKHTDGSTFFLEGILSHIKLEGEQFNFQLILRDITERKRAENAIHMLNEELEERVKKRTHELKQAQKQLLIQERMAALGQLIATVAHELRTPLGTVRSSLFTIEDAVSREEKDRVKKAVTFAERNVVRCDNILSELLDFTRKKGPQLSPVRIDEWLAQILDEISEHEGVQVISDLKTNILAAIDPWILKRAIVNVIQNAAEALGKCNSFSESKIFISSSYKNERIELTIKDTGPGMDAETLERALEPLFSTKKYGIGLGLPIVQKIMIEHDGGIEIVSEKNEGVTVVLWLPVIHNCRN